MLLKRDLPIKFRATDLRPDRAIAARIVRVGVPGTLEHLVRTIASFGLVKLLAGFGAVVL